MHVIRLPDMVDKHLALSCHHEHYVPVIITKYKHELTTMLSERIALTGKTCPMSRAMTCVHRISMIIMQFAKT